MQSSVNRPAFGSPHCTVCPLFLGQAVPVVRTKAGYALFCEVCELGHGPISVRASRRVSLRMTVQDEGDAAALASEEE